MLLHDFYLPVPDVLRVLHAPARDGERDYEREPAQALERQVAGAARQLTAAILFGALQALLLRKAAREPPQKVLRAQGRNGRGSQSQAARKGQAAKRRKWKQRVELAGRQRRRPSS